MCPHMHQISAHQIILALDQQPSIFIRHQILLACEELNGSWRVPNEPHMNVCTIGVVHLYETYAYNLHIKFHLACFRGYTIQNMYTTRMPKGWFLCQNSENYCLENLEFFKWCSAHGILNPHGPFNIKSARILRILMAICDSSFGLEFKTLIVFEIQGDNYHICCDLGPTRRH